MISRFVLLLISLGFLSLVESSELVPVSIATGNETGVYFPAGGAICRLTNKTSKENGFRCYVESTEGSAYNLGALAEGHVDFAVVQSDWLYHAYRGTDRFEDAGPNRKLRLVFALHPEAFTVVARADAKINSFDDLKGKRVNIGNQGSGQRATLQVLMDEYGWTNAAFSEALEIKAIEQPRALCNDQIDAMLYMVGHPSGAVKEATALCKSKVVPVTGTYVDKLIADHPYYRTAVIPKGMYRGNSEAVKTFGVGAVFVANESASEEVVYRMVKAVFENIDLFRRLHPALAGLKREEMLMQKSLLPMHPGAKRYFQETGLLGAD